MRDADRLARVEEHFERDPAPVRNLLLSRGSRIRPSPNGSSRWSPKQAEPHDVPRPQWAAQLTAADLVAELRKMPPHVTACILDDQGFPYEIGEIRYNDDLDMVTIESRLPR